MIPDRILNKIKVDEETDCWNWTGYVGPNGYGGLTFEGVRTHAHRVLYELLKGKIKGHIDHTCRNRQCCNPDHLEDVTPQDNTARGKAHRRTETHCKHGHRWDELGPRGLPNLREQLQSDGTVCRQCRACAREKEARRRCIIDD